jgi:hypothetical protein
MLMSGICQQVRHYSTYVCLCFLRLLSELCKIMVSKRSLLRFVTYLVKEVIVRHNFGLNIYFGFFLFINFSRNAVPVISSFEHIQLKCA